MPVNQEWLQKQLDQMREVHQENSLKIALVLQKIDQFILYFDDAKIERKELEKRVTKLEQWRTFIAGAAAVLVILFTLVQFVVPYFLK